MQGDFNEAVFTKQRRGRKSVLMVLHGDVIERSDLRTLIDGGLARLIARRLIACGIRPDRVCLTGNKGGLRERRKGGMPTK